MVMVILEKVPQGLRGELTRWMLEPKSGIFVGSVTGMVRERLWQKLCDESRGILATKKRRTDLNDGEKAELLRFEENFRSRCG